MAGADVTGVIDRHCAMRGTPGTMPTLGASTSWHSRRDAKKHSRDHWTTRSNCILPGRRRCDEKHRSEVRLRKPGISKESSLHLPAPKPTVRAMAGLPP